MDSFTAGNVTEETYMTDIDEQNQLAAKIIDYVFSGIVKTDPESFLKAYLQDVHTPVEVPSVLGGTTWTSVSDLDSYASEAQVINASKDHDWLYPKEPIDSLDQLNSLIQRSDFMQGSRSFDAKDVYGSRAITNSFFIKNCYDLQDSIFCSHLKNKQYCVANMQYTKEEYKVLKKKIFEWLF